MNRNENTSLYYLKSAPIPASILHMALPMMASLALDLAYNMIDAYFVGRLDDTAMMAALTLAFPLQILFLGIAQVFGVGAGTLIPRRLGEGDADGARRAASTSYYGLFIAGAAAGALLLPFAPTIARALGARGQSLDATLDFIRVSLVGAPFLVACPALAEMIRGEGASKASMAGMALSVIVNIALDPLFIFGLRMGVAGAALATALANGAAVAYFSWYLSRRSPALGISPGDFSPTKRMLADILGVGSSALVFTSLMLVSSLLFNAFAMGYGDSAIAAFGIANRITQICEFLAQGLFAGIVPLIAYAYGAGDRRRLSAVVKAAVGAFVAATLAIGALIYGFKLPILSLFSRDPLVLERGFDVLAAMLVGAFFGGFANIFADGFQAVGAAGPAAALSSIRGIVLIPLILAGRLAFGLEGIIWALPASEILGAAAGGLLWLAKGRGILAVPAAESAAA